MYIELDQNNCFTAYCNSLSQVAPEHSAFVIQVTDALYQLLITKMPFKMATIDTTKIYDVPDIALFIEILPNVAPTNEDRITALEAATAVLMGV
jgi:hypothetical protein